MAKVTSKLQVTLPRAIATRHGIRPGDEIDWVDAGEAIRIVPSPGLQTPPADTEERLKIFDRATQRTRARAKKQKLEPAVDRGWKREDAYVRGSSH
jgi:bifunctional DNA-binding transcriptional regulator/antitoxin component of YhaV-PrlF toxin-antitoxin module